jgi:hypothetical protein
MTTRREFLRQTGVIGAGIQEHGMVPGDTAAWPG